MNRKADTLALKWNLKQLRWSERESQLYIQVKKTVTNLTTIENMNVDKLLEAQKQQ